MKLFQYGTWLPSFGLRKLFFCPIIPLMCSMMSRRRSLLFFLLFLVGCTDTTPSVGFLKTDAVFDFTNSSIVTSNLNSVPLKAFCSPLISSIEVSFDGGATWILSSDYQSSAKCEAGYFNVTLSNTLAPLSTMVVNKGDTFDVQFRALSKMGSYIHRIVNVTFTPPVTGSQQLLVASQQQNGAGILLRGRIRGETQQVATGGSFKITGRIVE